MLRWYPDKKTTDVDYYAVRVDEKWLDGATIDDATMTPVGDTGLTISEIEIQSDVVSAKFEGGQPGGHEIEITIHSGNRIRTKSVYLSVSG